VPVLSIEGDGEQTDFRRGPGTHEKLEALMTALRRAGVFFGLSLTVTRANYDTVTDEDFVGRAIREGCRLFFYLEYTPICAGTEDWALSDEQRSGMRAVMAGLRKDSGSAAVFVAVPWDEEQTGGCLAAGRGFVHINSAGDLEPCPFVPYSDTNVLRSGLRAALASPFLHALRQNHEDFAETAGGCTLWRHRDRLRALLAPRAFG